MDYCTIVDNPKDVLWIQPQNGEHLFMRCLKGQSYEPFDPFLFLVLLFTFNMDPTYELAKPVLRPF